MPPQSCVLCVAAVVVALIEKTHARNILFNMQNSSVSHLFFWGGTCCNGTFSVCLYSRVGGRCVGLLFPLSLSMLVTFFCTIFIYSFVCAEIARTGDDDDDMMTEEGQNGLH